VSDKRAVNEVSDKRAVNEVSDKRAVNEVSDKRAVNEVSDKRRTKRISAEVLYGFLFSVCQCYPDIQYHNWKTFVSLNMFNNSSQ